MCCVMQSQSYSMISTHQHKTSLTLPKFPNSPFTLIIVPLCHSPLSPLSLRIIHISHRLELNLKPSTFLLPFFFFQFKTFSFTTFFLSFPQFLSCTPLCPLAFVPLLFSSQFGIFPNIQNKTISVPVSANFPLNPS